MAGFDASWFSARYADAAACRARLAGNRSWRWPDLAIDDAGSPVAGFNQVTLLAPAAPSLASLASLGERVARAFDASAAPGFRLFSAWPTPDLTGSGLVDPRPSTCLIRQVDAADPPAAAPPPELTIRRVTTPADLDRFEAVLDAGFREQRSGAIFPAAVLADRSIRLWLGIVESEAVGCSAAYLVGGAVGVDHIATRPEACGRGYGTALTWQATRTEPNLPAFLEASALGLPIYQRLGYRVVCASVAWTGRTGGTQGTALIESVEG